MLFAQYTDTWRHVRWSCSYYFFPDLIHGHPVPIRHTLAGKSYQPVHSVFRRSFSGIWFAVTSSTGSLPDWFPFLLVAIFIAIPGIAVVLTMRRPPNVLMWAERRLTGHDIEAVVMDLAIWLMMFLFGISVLGRFQW